MLQLANYKTQKRIAWMLIISLGALIFPHTKLLGHEFTSETMVFDTSSATKASPLYIHEGGSGYVPSKRTVYITVTSYNSVPEQTDSTPFTTALGTETRDGVIATNYLPFRTKVRFPDLYGDKVFVVEDRMNARYHKKVDIWSADMEFSRQFGARYLRMEIL